MDNISDTKFYIVVNREKSGPFSIDELKTMNITPKTKVWCKGMTNWDNAENVYCLKEVLVNAPSTSTPPPIIETPPVFQPEQTQPAQIPPTPPTQNQPIEPYPPTTPQQLPQNDKNIVHIVIAAIVFIIIVATIIIVFLYKPDSSRSEEIIAVDSTSQNIIPDDPIKQLEYDMVTINGGTLMLGATSEQSAYAMNQEFPAHEVTLSTYQIGRYEVTQEQWEAVMGYNPSHNIGAKMPVENVSWNECQSFLQTLNAKTGKNYRLPTEAEWEFAARGGNQSHYYIYSGSDNPDAVAWHKGNSGGTTHDVGTKQANELGLYDMSGNVFEWCNDKYGYYSYSAEYNPQGNGTSSKVRVGHGGGYNLGTKFCRVSNRTQGTTNYKSESLGFRIAHD